eukprot:TRINITY_DN3280_c0_g1_i1.p1 TRINITY_DN3280_c0_g1~~TRINITY_DN3280_c0_g1_i1.p1  ORF type:complete len:211 (+),score=16.49 TRINITY_DN3280_c0_g1_i1:103-735(+)
MRATYFCHECESHFLGEGLESCPQCSSFFIELLEEETPEEEEMEHINLSRSQQHTHNPQGTHNTRNSNNQQAAHLIQSVFGLVNNLFNPAGGNDQDGIAPLFSLFRNAMGGSFTGTGQSLEEVLNQLFEAHCGDSGIPPLSKENRKLLVEKTLQAGDPLLGEDCVVCQDSFEVSSTTVSLPCAHHFHKGCIMPWLDRHASCPTCRAEVKS